MKILCMSHGTMAQGVVQSAKMIVGDVQFLEYINAYVDQETNIDHQIKTFLKQNNNQTIIVCTDLFGGSVNNYWMKYLDSEKNLYLIAGLSLPLIIELVLKIEQKSGENINDIISSSIKNAKKSLTFCNKLDFHLTHEEF
ncbi:PTS sugar transporter subunit IIA [Lactobacillus panisapium]|uniref:PTS sugar transporter subunit IIA n=1 Tax=Lactobacillus panisapium TaxID=2012495 RepID=UPI001C6A02C3|nr:PTS sugar transporter subunit IIA [Lactobacillus panisapium]QYN57230.1 PTS sugar transporter subunit IIA [Lactobacillus panisapium]